MSEPTFDIPPNMLVDKMLDAYKNPPYDKSKHEKIQWLTVVLGYVKLAIDQTPHGDARTNLYNKWREQQAAAERLHTLQQRYAESGPVEGEPAQDIDTNYINRVQSLIGDVVQALSGQSPRT